MKKSKILIFVILHLTALFFTVIYAQNNKNSIDDTLKREGMFVKTNFHSVYGAITINQLYLETVSNTVDSKITEIENTTFWIENKDFANKPNDFVKTRKQEKSIFVSTQTKGFKNEAKYTFSNNQSSGIFGRNIIFVAVLQTNTTERKYLKIKKAGCQNINLPKSEMQQALDSKNWLSNKFCNTTKQTFYSPYFSRPPPCYENKNRSII